MTAARMGGIQAVVAELGDVHDGTVTAGQLHFHESNRSEENDGGATGGISAQNFGSTRPSGPAFGKRLGCSPIKAVRELGSERRETVRSLSVVGAGNLRGVERMLDAHNATSMLCAKVRGPGSDLL